MRTWIVVCDAARARVFESRGNLQHLALVAQLEHPQSRRKEEALGMVRRGSVTTGTGIHGGLPEQTSPKEHEAEQFARILADRMNHAVADQTCQRLVLVAPPHFLGLLRKQLNSAAQACLHRTIDKDYTQLALQELATALGNRE